MPEFTWIKCVKCGKMLYEDAVVEKYKPLNMMCPSCSFEIQVFNN